MTPGARLPRAPASIANRPTDRQPRGRDDHGDDHDDHEQQRSTSIAWERHQEITGSDAMISDDAWERYPDIATPDTGDHDYRAVYYHVSANEIMRSLHRSIGLADTTNERRYTEKVEQLVADHRVRDSWAAHVPEGRWLAAGANGTGTDALATSAAVGGLGSEP